MPDPAPRRIVGYEFAARSLAACAVATIALVAATAPLAAQHVRVVLTATGTANPVPGAIVSLERAGIEVRIGPVLSDDGGRALLAAPSPGSYRVRVDRIGAATWRSPVLELSRADTLDYRAAVDLTATMLHALVVEGKSSCGSRADEDRVLAVWEEARKGVLASSLGREHGTPFLSVRRFDRLLTARGRVEAETADSVVAATIRPFDTVRSAAELSRLGYVVEDPPGATFLAPDADVLLSEEFVSDHCLSLVTDRREPGLVGVAFEPVKGRTLPDIAGTFWLDVDTSEPRSLTFEYVNVSRMSRAARAGGALTFLRLPTGDWTVNEWVVRTPRRGIIRNYFAGGNVVEVDTLLGAREEGAEVLDVVARPGRAAGGDGRRRELAGTIFDSLAGRPLPGVSLRLLGTGAQAVTDSLGRYALAVEDGGRYTVELSHPRLALFRVAASREVTVGDDGAATRFDLAIPPRARLRAQLCPRPESDEEPAGAGILVGRTVSAADGRPIARAALLLSYVRQRAEGNSTITIRPETVWRRGVSDADGHFLFCHVPRDVPLGLVTEAPRSVTARQTLRIVDRGIEELTVRMAPCDGGKGVPECADPE